MSCDSQSLTSPLPSCLERNHGTQIASLRFRGWSKSIGEGLGKTVVELTGEAAADLKLLERGTVIVATAQHWDALSRRWKQRKNVQVLGRVGLTDKFREAPLFS